MATFIQRNQQLTYEKEPLQLQNVSLVTKPEEIFQEINQQKEMSMNEDTQNIKKQQFTKVDNDDEVFLSKKVDQPTTEANQDNNLINEAKYQLENEVYKSKVISNEVENNLKQHKSPLINQSEIKEQQNEKQSFHKQYQQQFHTITPSINHPSHSSLNKSSFHQYKQSLKLYKQKNYDLIENVQDNPENFSFADNTKSQHPVEILKQLQKIHLENSQSLKKISSGVLSKSVNTHSNNNIRSRIVQLSPQAIKQDRQKRMRENQSKLQANIQFLASIKTKIYYSHSPQKKQFNLPISNINFSKPKSYRLQTLAFTKPKPTKDRYRNEQRLVLPKIYENPKLSLNKPKPYSIYHVSQNDKGMFIIPKTGV